MTCVFSDEVRYSGGASRVDPEPVLCVVHRDHQVVEVVEGRPVEAVLGQAEAVDGDAVLRATAARAEGP